VGPPNVPPGTVERMPETVALSELPRRAGAVMTLRDGRPVPAHYGSAATELAVCMRGVGLTDRSDLAVLSVTAGRRGLDRLLERALGHRVVPGGAVLDAGGWWCRAAARPEIVVVCPFARVERLKAGLRRDVARFTTGTLTDRSDSRLVLQVTGRRAGAVLADLGVYGPARDPHAAQPFTELEDGSAWLLETPTRALAIVAAGGGAETWRAIERAGRPYGIGCVGLEAIERYLIAA
jgi:glycine cleavage system aminomethyltransferase T